MEGDHPPFKFQKEYMYICTYFVSVCDRGCGMPIKGLVLSCEWRASGALQGWQALGLGRGHSHHYDPLSLIEVTQGTSERQLSIAALNWYMAQNLAGMQDSVERVVGEAPLSQ